MEIEVSEKEKRRSDPYIWGIIIILYIVSVVEVYSAISREITGGDVYSPIINISCFFSPALSLLMSLPRYIINGSRSWPI